MGDTFPIIIEIISALSVLVLGIGMVMLALVWRRTVKTLRSIERALGRVSEDARPVFDRARAIGENLNFLVMSVRKEVERVGETVARANDRLNEAIEAAEDRVRELGAVIDLTKGEVEDTLLTASSALRGLRTGVRVLSSRRRSKSEEGDDEDDD